MTRIIQDSDEECEEEVLEEHVQNDTQAQDASSPHLVPEPAGTGSTGRHLLDTSQGMVNGLNRVQNH
jgi:hypothetical protein